MSRGDKVDNVERPPSLSVTQSHGDALSPVLG